MQSGMKSKLGSAEKNVSLAEVAAVAFWLCRDWNEAEFVVETEINWKLSASLSLSRSINNQRFTIFRKLQSQGSTGRLQEFKISVLSRFVSFWAPWLNRFIVQSLFFSHPFFKTPPRAIMTVDDDDTKAVKTRERLLCETIRV